MIGRRRDGIDAGGQGGFTLIEMLLVAVIIGILVQVAIPNFRTMRTRARAVDMVGRINVIRTAVQNYNADTFQWPEEAATGVRPAELTQQYLDPGFVFGGDGYELDWENLTIPGGLPQDPSTTRILGVAVVVDSDDLGEAIVDVFGTSGWYNVGSSYVFIVERQ